MRYSWGLAVGGVALVAVASAVLPAATVTAQSAPNDRAFKQYCGVCHTVVAGKSGAMGPNLKGVVGRKSGTAAFAYSPAMKGANIKWTTQNLDRFLAGPGKMVPGTRMVVGVSNPASRAEIIRYLATVK